jgi:hypothetical protein
MEKPSFKQLEASFLKLLREEPLTEERVATIAAAMMHTCIAGISQGMLLHGDYANASRVMHVGVENDKVMTQIIAGLKNPEVPQEGVATVHKLAEYVH